ncbi:hypothetical protein F0562_033355 [Nyssa sinensis]|uniref:Uncharacterized protein n=1 Tax=Nyssa sinensis TaxID=561372 RepID=A0A5J5ATU0_9ASTE|nr:hypothetical protein F0562_033355 [Nyssa sinensis]
MSGFDSHFESVEIRVEPGPASGPTEVAVNPSATSSNIPPISSNEATPPRIPEEFRCPEVWPLRHRGPRLSGCSGNGRRPRAF